MHNRICENQFIRDFIKPYIIYIRIRKFAQIIPFEFTLKYKISYEQAHRHFIDFEVVIDNLNQDEVIIQLPSWRPGRYELGNFAKNIQKWNAFDTKGNVLTFQKVNKDCWKIISTGCETIIVKYNYYANELTAGSTLLNEEQLYMNPVNCCIYIPERINEMCEVELYLPEDYKVAIGALVNSSKKGVHNIVFNNFHELADNPFIASNSLKHGSFIVKDIKFNVWLQGECNPNWEKVCNDFSLFASEQLNTMKKVPINEYHFLVQVTPQRTYHGVEHTTSTVIALGPGHSLMKGITYEDLLGVCSHELFHVWNIKTIRPVEMYPYDYSKENYSKLGYVAEGVTTYYGDFFLFRSKVFNEEQYFKTFNERLQRHYDNYGRFNLSVADSSFDTWLDGYVKGVPNRKTSIYGEGCLLAFVTDIFIRKNSNNKHCLDNVMQHLYAEYYLNNKGYSDMEYKKAIELFAGASFDNVFDNYINGAADYTPILNEAMSFVGCEIKKTISTHSHENRVGIKTIETNGICKVSSVVPNSVGDNAGIAVSDEIIAINNVLIRQEGVATNFSNWCNYFSERGDKQVTVTLSSNKMIKKVSIIFNDDSYFETASIAKSSTANAEQKNNFKLWSKNEF